MKRDAVVIHKATQTERPLCVFCLASQLQEGSPALLLIHAESLIIIRGLLKVSGVPPLEVNIMDLWSEQVGGKKNKKQSRVYSTSPWEKRELYFSRSARRHAAAGTLKTHCLNGRRIKFVQRDEQLVSVVVVVVVERLKITLPPLVFASPSLLSAKEEKRRGSNLVHFDERARMSHRSIRRPPPGAIVHFKRRDASIQSGVSSS